MLTSTDLPYLSLIFTINFPAASLAAAWGKDFISSSP
jgi:hypothetical protein